MSEKRLEVLGNELKNILGAEAEEILEILSDPERSPLLLEDAFNPESNIDGTLEDLLSLVARSSNSYVRLARFSGVSKAYHKILKGEYERKYKAARVGKNDAEREKNAMEQCQEEHLQMTTMEAISELAEKFENAARVASESSRKILDKGHDTYIGEQRKDYGKFKDKDFT